MTRTPFDTFSKQVLEELLAPWGTVQVNREIPGESQFVDVYFIPTTPLPANPPDLGWLSRIASIPCLIEPFRNPVTLDEVRGCLSKLLLLQAETIRRAKRAEQARSQVQLPELWVLTPSLSEEVLTSLGASSDEAFEAGIYQLPSALNTKIAVIHQLPNISDTLWLRVLGRGRVQQRAIAEVLALPLQDQRRAELLRLLAGLKITIEATAESIDTDQELMMALSQAYLEWEQATEQRGIQKGRQEGERSLILLLLQQKIGQLPDNLGDRVSALSVSQLESLAIALLNFNKAADLERWLADIDKQ